MQRNIDNLLEDPETLIDKFADYLYLHKANSPSSVEWKRYIIRKMLIDIMDGNPRNYTRLLPFIRSLEIDTQKTYMYVIRQFYEWLATISRESGNLDLYDEFTEFAEDIRVPRGSKRPQWLTIDEAKALLDTAKGEKDPRKYAVIKFMLSTGLRVSEFVSMNLTDFKKDGNSYLLRIKGKGNKERILRISEDLYNLLVESGWFNKKVHRRTIHRWVSDIGKKIGLNVHPHTLRHTFAHTLLERGESLAMIQALLGHSSISTTGRYVRESSAEVMLGRDF